MLEVNKCMNWDKKNKKETEATTCAFPPHKYFKNTFYIKKQFLF